MIPGYPRDFEPKRKRQQQQSHAEDIDIFDQLQIPPSHNSAPGFQFNDDGDIVLSNDNIFHESFEVMYNQIVNPSFEFQQGTQDLTPQKLAVSQGQLPHFTVQKSLTRRENDQEEDQDSEGPDHKIIHSLGSTFCDGHEDKKERLEKDNTRVICEIFCRTFAYIFLFCVFYFIIEKYYFDEFF